MWGEDRKPRAGKGSKDAQRISEGLKHTFTIIIMFHNVKLTRDGEI